MSESAASPPSRPGMGLRKTWMRILAAAAVIGLAETAVMLLLNLVDQAGLGWPYWLRVMLDAEIVTVSAVLLFWFGGVKRLSLRLAEETQRASFEQRLNADLKRALDAHALVSICDVSGAITFVNAKFCETSGYSEAELLGRDHRLFNSGYHDKDYFEAMWRTITQGGLWQGELRNRRKDGSHYWVDTTIIPFLDERGRPYQYVAMRRDITELKEAKLRAWRLGERLQWLLGASPSVLYANENPRDLAQCTFVSGNAPAVVGYTAEEMLARRGFWLEHLHPDDRPAASAHLGRLLEAGQATVEYRFQAADGQYRWIRDHARVVRDGQGGLQAIVGACPGRCP